MSEPAADNSNSNPVAPSSCVISQDEKAAIVINAMPRSDLDIPVDDLITDAQAQLANLQFVERNLLTEVI